MAEQIDIHDALEPREGTTPEAILADMVAGYESRGHDVHESEVRPFITATGDGENTDTSEKVREQLDEFEEELDDLLHREIRYVRENGFEHEPAYSDKSVFESLKGFAKSGNIKNMSAKRQNPDYAGLTRQLKNAETFSRAYQRIEEAREMVNRYGGMYFFTVRVTNAKQLPRHRGKIALVCREQDPRVVEYVKLAGDGLSETPDISEGDVVSVNESIRAAFEVPMMMEEIRENKTEECDEYYNDDEIIREMYLGT